MSPEFISVVTALCALVVSVIPLVAKWLYLSKERKSEVALEITIEGVNDDGTPKKITVDRTSLTEAQVQQIIESIRIIGAEPTVTKDGDQGSLK